MQEERTLPFQKEEVLPYMSGLWREALQSICGLQSSVFNKKHQSCPNCGGKDRFRWTDKLKKPGDGGAVCNVCGNDTGIGWLMKLTGEPYSECINILGRFLGKIPQEKVFKANKRASQTTEFRNGAQAEHEACLNVLNRTEKRSITPLSVYEGIYNDSYDVGVKKLEDGSEKVFHVLPCSFVHEDGVDDEYCNLLLIGEDGTESFYAKDWTRASVVKTAPDPEFADKSKNIFLCVSWIDAQHIHLIAPSAEVWTCFTYSNMEIVAHRYKGDKMVAVCCEPGDMEAIYVADDRELPVILSNGKGFRSGMQRKFFKADELI